MQRKMRECHEGRYLAGTVLTAALITIIDLKEVLEVTNVRKASEMVPTVREDAPGTFASGF